MSLYICIEREGVTVCFIMAGLALAALLGLVSVLLVGSKGDDLDAAMGNEGLWGASAMLPKRSKKACACLHHPRGEVPRAAGHGPTTASACACSSVGLLS